MSVSSKQNSVIFENVSVIVQQKQDYDSKLW